MSDDTKNAAKENVSCAVQCRVLKRRLGTSSFDDVFLKIYPKKSTDFSQTKKTLNFDYFKNSS